MSEPRRSHTDLFDTLYLGVGVWNYTCAVAIMAQPGSRFQDVELFLLLMIQCRVRLSECVLFWPCRCFFRVGNNHQTPDRSGKCLSGRKGPLLSYSAVFGVPSSQSMFVFNSRLIKYVVIYSHLNKLKVKVVSAFHIILFIPRKRNVRIRIMVG